MRGGRGEVIGVRGSMSVPALFDRLFSSTGNPNFRGLQVQEGVDHSPNGTPSLSNMGIVRGGSACRLLARFDVMQLAVGSGPGLREAAERCA